MALPNPPTAFPFVDLPREIRNKIYRETLCSFESRPTPIVLTPKPDIGSNSADIDTDSRDIFHIAKHTIDTSILLVSKQVHREAYDVMVKTNRFVRVTTSPGVPIQKPLEYLCVPVVTGNKTSVDQFQGYVLSVSITRLNKGEMDYQDGSSSSEACSLMILGRDMIIFCDALMDGDKFLSRFRSKVFLEISVAPANILIPSPYRDSVADFFTEKTQETLLQPFHNRLRGFKRTRVTGSCSRAIAEAVELVISQDAVSDPAVMLRRYQEALNRGQKLFKRPIEEEADQEFKDLSTSIKLMHRNGLFDIDRRNDLERMGVDIITPIAGIILRSTLNAAELLITAMQREEPFADFMAAYALRQAIESTKDDYWMPGYRYEITEEFQAQLDNNRAAFIRLLDEFENNGVSLEMDQVLRSWVADDTEIAEG